MEAQQAETRQRLLEVAGQVFAELGFRATTIREVCKRANANVAAVNYHFGDKERLYAEVLRYASYCAREKYEGAVAANSELSPEQRLEKFVRAFLGRILDEGRPAWHGKLMAREIMDPTPALDELVDTQMRPVTAALSEIVQSILGASGDDPVLIRRCLFSIVGQCLYYRHSRPFVTRLYPQENLNVDELAAHISRFSLAALRGLAGEGKS